MCYLLIKGGVDKGNFTLQLLNLEPMSWLFANTAVYNLLRPLDLKPCLSLPVKATQKECLQHLWALSVHLFIYVDYRWNYRYAGSRICKQMPVQDAFCRNDYPAGAWLFLSVPSSLSQVLISGNPSYRVLEQLSQKKACCLRNCRN